MLWNCSVLGCSLRKTKTRSRGQMENHGSMFPSEQTSESKLAAKALFTLKKSCEMQPSQVLKMVEKLLGSH